MLCNSFAPWWDHAHARARHTFCQHKNHTQFTHVIHENVKPIDTVCIQWLMKIENWQLLIWKICWSIDERCGVHMIPNELLWFSTYIFNVLDWISNVIIANYAVYQWDEIKWRETFVLVAIQLYSCTKLFFEYSVQNEQSKRLFEVWFQ